MQHNVISSYADFCEKCKMNAEGNERAEALKKYFGNGGVISVSKAKAGWPKLMYPSPLRIKSQIKDLNELRQKYSQKLREWEGAYISAKIYHIKNNVLKLSEPLYWKHMAKYSTDKDYRSDADSVKLPAHLAPDARWKPMIRMFVDDVEYRKNLVETVQHSIVYKDDRKVAKYANVLQAFRQDISGKNIGLLKKKIDELDEGIRTQEIMLVWARE